MEEHTILELQQQMDDGRLSARELTEAYLARIDEVDPPAGPTAGGTEVTILGAGLALPLSLWSTTYGNPNRFLRGAIRTFNAVVRSIPDLLWALIFVSAVGIGALSGLLALVFFSLAVTTKLTSDTLDGIDMGPVEAANASGASLNQMLRTATATGLPSLIRTGFMSSSAISGKSIRSCESRTIISSSRSMSAAGRFRYPCNSEYALVSCMSRRASNRFMGGSPRALSFKTSV